jgi:hypothetical protein
MKIKKIILYTTAIALFLGARTTLAEVSSFEFKNIKADICLQPTFSAPLAKTHEILNISSSTAVLSATVNPQNLPTKYWFEFDTDKNIDGGSGFFYAGKTDDDTNALFDLKELVPNTTYYYRVVAENNKGVITGETMSFKTNNS